MGTYSSNGAAVVTATEHIAVVVRRLLVRFRIRFSFRAQRNAHALTLARTRLFTSPNEFPIRRCRLYRRESWGPSSLLRRYQKGRLSIYFSTVRRRYRRALTSLHDRYRDTFSRPSTVALTPARTGRDNATRWIEKNYKTKIVVSKLGFSKYFLIFEKNF